MAGSLTALALQNLAEIIQNATAAGPGFSTKLWLNLYHISTMDDAITIASTGRLGDDFQTTLSNTTTVWTLASATSPSAFQNKVVITVTSDAASTGTVRSFALQDTSSTSAGNILVWGDVTPVQAVTTGNTVQFSTGALTFNVGGTTGGITT